MGQKLGNLEILQEPVTIKLSKLLDSINGVLIGQQLSVKLTVTAFIAGGHVLLEDVPGVGKTLLAKTMANSLQATFKRIQCTPDLMPTDISGVSVYNQRDGIFSFMPGPIFTNILLTDEINRATPRTQSSLLEAMEENQVTIDGESRPLPQLFFVIATENPIEYHGTFPLPEAQLDRFMLSLSLGYPKPEDEVLMLMRTLEQGAFDASPVLTVEEALHARDLARAVFIDDSLKRYIVDIVNATRKNPQILLGVSPRGSQLLMRASQASALLDGRDYVEPDDIKLLAPYIFGHRITPKNKSNKVSHAEIIEDIIKQIPVPV